jgi:hypothetical protein
MGSEDEACPLGPADGKVATKIVPWQACFGQRAEQPLRQRSSFQSDPLEVVGSSPQNLQQSIGFARDLHFPTILPVSSTMQTLVSLTETSSPAKWSMLRFPF